MLRLTSGARGDPGLYSTGESVFFGLTRGLWGFRVLPISVRRVVPASRPCRPSQRGLGALCLRGGLVRNRWHDSGGYDPGDLLNRNKWVL